MYCIECGSPIEATARMCGVCRFPQPLEEFADLEPALAGNGPRTVLPVRFVEANTKPVQKPRLAPAIAVFIALCISTGLSVYLLTRQSPNAQNRSGAEILPADDKPAAGNALVPTAVPTAPAAVPAAVPAADPPVTRADSPKSPSPRGASNSSPAKGG